MTPSVNWGDESTFDFCFEGIEKGSVVAVSTCMASEHDNRCDQKAWLWHVTTRCCGALSRRKLSAIIRRFPKCKAISFMWTMNAVPGGI